MNLNHPFIRTHLLPYRFTMGKEVPGFVVELDNTLNGGVEVGVLFDANVVSAVTLATLQHGVSEA